MYSSIHSKIRPLERLIHVINLRVRLIVKVGFDGLFSNRLKFYAVEDSPGKESRFAIRRMNIRSGIADLSPGYFALVMATGIVSIAAHIYGLKWIAYGLLYFNIVAYLWLFALSILRLIFFTKRCAADFYNPRKSPGFLSFVAGSCVLGTQLVFLRHDYFWSSGLYFIALISWVFLIYAFFTVITIEHNKPTFDKAINGVWLLVIVSSQAISVLGILLAKHFSFSHHQILFLSLIMFLCGCMFYLIVITLIVYRMSFFELMAREFAPSYWINMGAVAISALAGSFLISHAGDWIFLESLLPFLKGFTLFFWAIGTWWIPFIIILDVWRYVIKRLPITYHPQFWDVVFPLGMYTVCTLEMSWAMNLPFIKGIPSVSVYVAIVVWGITFLGMVMTVGKNLTGRHYRRTV